MRYHPWVFSGAIKELPKELQDGDIVEVLDSNQNFLAIGMYQKGSISIRILSWKKREINADFWKESIEHSFEMRKLLGIIDNKDFNSYRIINAEGDNIPGLIVDYYNGVLVFQAHNLGIYHQKDIICDILQQIHIPIESIYDKSASALMGKTIVPTKDSFLYGNTEEIEILEYGKKFCVRITDGQKTGFFLDQRENRLWIEKFCKNKKVLNAFCYTGGFSIAALKGGALELTSVDSSEKTIELAIKNENLNFQTKSSYICKDMFDFFSSSSQNYDVIILDPPAFVKSASSKENGLKGYKNINANAMKKINKNGIIFTFSCSQGVSSEEFKREIFHAAETSHKKIQIIHQTHHSLDHPIHIYHPEGEYLKGFGLYIS